MDKSLAGPKGREIGNDWSLPSQLAQYFNEYRRKFFDNDYLADGKGLPIKEVNPVPENIVKIPKLDNFVGDD